jgi:radical SAM superfamily enzyme YgiQ (UPF0313 family)
MLNQTLKDRVVRRLLPRVQTPGQYLGGELHAAGKDHAAVRGKLCLAFPDTYAIGMSNHGIQVLYSVMNRREDWACERTYAPWPDMESLLRAEDLPLYSLETFTPLDQFDVLGFSLQHELCCTNVLTMLDLGRVGLIAEERPIGAPLVIAGGPCVQNPEPMARFFDAIVIGDGEESLPAVCDAWLELKRSGLPRREALARLAAEVPHVYVPSCYRAACWRRRPRTGPGAPLRGVCRADPAGGRRRPRRDAVAGPAARAEHRVRPGPDFDRDHARLPVEMPILPGDHHQAPLADQEGPDNRRGGLGVLPEHGLQRDLAALAVDQRLP